MLRLRTSILTHLLSSSAASPVSPLHHLLSSAAPRISPNPSFPVEQYLVDTCRLTRPQALKASLKLSHLKSPTKPDAVLAFLAGLGLSGTDVAALVAKDPHFLCAGVDTILAPNVTELTGLGLSRCEIARIVSHTPTIFRRRTIVSSLLYYQSLFGSTEKLIQFLKQGHGLLTSSVEKVVKPNVTFLRQCGLTDCDISKLCLSTPWVVSTNPEHVQATVACAEGLGLPCGSGMFRHALIAIAFIGVEKVAAKVDYLKSMFRWSDAEVRIALSKAPSVLTRSMDMLQNKSEFLISEVGLEPAHIAHRSVMILYSLEGRLRPRYYVVKFLKENGLLDPVRSYYSAVIVTEKVFLEKYISPHHEAAPYLAEDYASACRGEVPTNFRFI